MNKHITPMAEQLREMAENYKDRALTPNELTVLAHIIDGCKANAKIGYYTYSGVLVDGRDGLDLTDVDLEILVATLENKDFQLVVEDANWLYGGVSSAIVIKVSWAIN